MRKINRISRAAGKALRQLKAEIERLESRTLLAGTASISGVVFNDLNVSYMPEAGEPGVGGTTVYLDLNHDGQLDAGDVSTQTNATGAYSFTGLDSGSYSVAVVPPAGWAALSATGGAGLNDGGTVTLDFPLTQNSIAGGRVFADTNGNGVLDAGEQILSGFTVYVDTNGNGQLDPGEPRTVTDASQYAYRVQIQPGGTYKVRIAPQPGFIVIGPSSYDLWAYVPGFVGWGDFAVVPDQPPVANPGGPYTVGEGSSLALDGSASSDPAGTITQYEWDLDYNGTTFSPTRYGMKPVFDASAIDGPSQRTIALRVTDGQGNVSAIATTTVDIHNVAPTATFLKDADVVQGQTATVWFCGMYDPSAADMAAGFRYNYDLNGDGIYEIRQTHSNQATVPSEYLTTPGEHIVTAQIIDKDGDSNTYATTINVTPTVAATNTSLLGIVGAGIRNVVTRGTMAYALAGDRLEILDISDPSAPHRIGAVALDNGGGDLAVQGSYAYVADGQQIHVFDVSDPAHPTSVGVCPLPNPALHLQIQGSLAYVADNYGGLQILDISNPTAPTLVGSLELPNHPFLDVAVSGSMAYLDGGWGQGLIEVDVSNPSSPRVLATFVGLVVGNAMELSGSLLIAQGPSSTQLIDVTNPAAPVVRSSLNLGNNVWGMHVEGTRAYVAAGDTGLWVVDISDLDHPAILGRYDTAGCAWEVEVSGAIAYVADGDDGLLTFDTSALAGPTYEGSWSSGTGVGQVVVRGSLAYVSAGSVGVAVLDISNPASPTFVGSVQTSFSVDHLAFYGNSLLVVEGIAGLQLIDISDPAAPAALGFIAMNGSSNLAVAGDYALVTGYTTELQVVDLSVPTAPTVVGTWNGPDMGWQVAAIGSYAYVAAGSAIRVVDISDPATPNWTGSIDKLQGDYIMSVASSGQYLYAEGTGLWAFDAGDAAHPRLVNVDWLGGWAPAMSLSGSRAYITMDQSSVRVIDISDPRSPCFVTDIPLTGQATVSVFGSMAYLGTSAGLQTIDVSTVSPPRLVAKYGLTAPAMDLVTVGQYEYAACGIEGLEILDLTDVANPVAIGSLPIWSIAQKVLVVGNYAYIGTQQGLWVVDVSDPHAPMLEGICSMPNTSVEDLYINGHYAYLASWTAGLQVVDIADPSNPVVVGSIATLAALKIGVAGSLLYLADNQGGLKIIDISDPTQPVVVGGWTGAAYVFGVSIVGSHALVAAYDRGLVVLDLTNPLAPTEVAAYATGYTYDVAYNNGQAYVNSSGGTFVLAMGDMSSALALGWGGATAGVQAKLDGTGLGFSNIYFTEDRIYVCASSLGLHVLSYSSPCDLAEDAPVGTALGQLIPGTSPTQPSKPLQMRAMALAERAAGSTSAETFKYAFVGGVGSDDNGLFAVDGDALVLASPLSGTRTSYSVRVRATGDQGHVYENTFQIHVNLVVPPDITPPSVSSAQVNDGSAQRSMVTKLVVTFSEPVALNDNSFRLVNRGGLAVAGVTIALANPTGDQMTWELTFGGPAVRGGSLPDGAYKLIVSAANVTDLAGNAMTGDYRLRFFRLYGDYNGDHVVNRTDLMAFRQALRSGTYVSYFDFDNSGTLTLADYNQLRRRMQRRLL